MAIESLMERGNLADWREFAGALKADEAIAARAVEVCRYREADGSERIALALVEHFHPALHARSDDRAAGFDEISAPQAFAGE